MSYDLSRPAVLAILGVLYWAAYTMLRPLVGPYVLNEGGSATEASIALASFGALPTLLAIPIGAMTDRWGARRLAIPGALMMVLGGPMMFLPPTLPTLITSQAVVGLGTLIYWVALQAVAVTPQSGDTRDKRNSRLAVFAFFMAAGQAIGPVLGGALESWGGFSLAFAGYTGISTLLVLLTLALPLATTTRKATLAPSGSMRTLGIFRSYREAFQLLRDPGVFAAVTVSFGGLVIWDMRLAYQPVLFTEAGLAQWTVGLLLGVAAVAGFLAPPFFARAMRSLGSKVMVGLVLGVGAVSLCAVALDPTNFLLLVLCALINGFAIGFVQPLGLALMSDAVAAGRQGLASALRAFANRGAQFANPAVFAGASTMVGLGGAFVVVSGLVLVLGAVSIAALKRLENPPPET